MKVRDERRQVWAYSDYNVHLKGVFGKMIGLWRCHGFLMEILQLIHDKKFGHVAGFASLTAQVLHEVALRDGEWERSLKILPIPDPL